jgi:energy-converting hydrogenase B subunit D
VIDVLRGASLLLVAVVATGVVLTREPLAQAMVASLLGLVLAVAFTLYHAPDVALSQIVVGAVALPLVILLSLAKIRRDDERHHRVRREPPEER